MQTEFLEKKLAELKAREIELAAKSGRNRVNLEPEMAQPSAFSDNSAGL
jgi:hypothetical protein